MEGVCLVAVIAQPIKLRVFADRVCSEFKQFAVTEVAELGRAMRIVTFRNHGQSCAMLILEEWMPGRERIDALHNFEAKDCVSCSEELGWGEAATDL